MVLWCLSIKFVPSIFFISEIHKKPPSFYRHSSSSNYNEYLVDFCLYAKNHFYLFNFADFDELDNQISDVRRQLKPKVSKLRDMEKREDIKGFNLNPLSKEEIQSVEQLIWQAFQCISDIPSTMYSVNGISGKVASLKKIPFNWLVLWLNYYYVAVNRPISPTENINIM